MSTREKAPSASLSSHLPAARVRLQRLWLAADVPENERNVPVFPFPFGLRCRILAACGQVTGKSGGIFLVTGS